ETQTQSSMPLPIMKYVDQYTDEAVKRGIAPKPPVPIQTSYEMFGQICHQDDAIIRPLESQGISQLHPEVYDKRSELKKMTVSILCSFLDLLDILVKAGVSTARDEKIEDLNLLFIHMHHLINEYRPHQARETLKVMMALQKKNLVDVGDTLCKNMEKASEILRQCSQELATISVLTSLDVDTPLLLGDPGISTSNSANDIEPMNIESVLGLNSSSVIGQPEPMMEVEQSYHDDMTNNNSVEDKDMLMCSVIDDMN
uniref:Mediator of RNA polymerase II transcription subunit 7 n=1 Tax=Ciona savignyi TaxID=51511 RepID=H2ZH60_CIOSA